MKSIRFFAFALLTVLAVSACASKKQTQNVANASAATTSDQTPEGETSSALPPNAGAITLLRKGDQLEVRIGGVSMEDVQLISGIYVVDDQGNVNLPHIGPIRAEGLSQSQLQAQIESAYVTKGIYARPTITINIPMTTRFVSVSGSVRAPNRVTYAPDLTVLSAIASAGGFNDFADQARVRILRGNEVIIVNCKQIRKDPSKDVPLLPGDKVEVPQSFW